MIECIFGWGKQHGTIAPSIVAKLRAISALKLILGYPLTDAAAYGHSKGEECGSFRAMAFTV